MSWAAQRPPGCHRHFLRHNISRRRVCVTPLDWVLPPPRLLKSNVCFPDSLQRQGCPHIWPCVGEGLAHAEGRLHPRLPQCNSVWYRVFHHPLTGLGRGRRGYQGTFPHTQWAAVVKGSGPAHVHDICPGTSRDAMASEACRPQIASLPPYSYQCAALR